jgi:group II intron reverse transcriptase/maturase
MRNTEGALKPESVSTKQKRIAELASQHPQRALCSLNHYLDEEWLRYAYDLTRKDAAVGIDGISGAEYASNLEANLADLLARMKSGRYWAPPVRRHWIPKGGGGQRPLGIPTFEDKVAQRAIVLLLEPIYETDFHPCSFGFRRGRSAHQALQSLRNHIMDEGGRWILDVDVRKYFDSIPHADLRRWLDLRVTDGVVRTLIDKWLKAGILEEGGIVHPTTGTPQGGVLSPLLANLYLHYVLDEWYLKEVQPRLHGRSSLVRFCDDFVMVFSCHEDATRVHRVLEKRLGRWGLALHPEKTRLVDFRCRRPAYPGWHSALPTTFTFLGFLHHWGKSRFGNWVVFQRTAKDRIARTLRTITEACRRGRHRSLPEQWRSLSRMIQGHLAYFGITGNGERLRTVVYKAERIWQKWLSRRTRSGRIPWSRFRLVLERWPLPRARIVHCYLPTAS